MNMKPALTISLVCALLWQTSETFAHHSFAAEFDGEKQGELQGTIINVWYQNPHVRFQIETRTQDGITEVWELQTRSITILRRQSWVADTIQQGDKVRVWGDLGRDQKRKLFVRGFEKEDGTKLSAWGSLSDPSDPNSITADPAKDYGYAQVNSDHPFDISGPWRNNYNFRLTVDDLDPKPTPFSASGKRIFDAREYWQDAVFRCMPMGLPRLFGAPYPMDIVDAGSHYQIIYVQNNAVRRIWMDGRTAPKDQPPTSAGFSTGHWEDDVLIIETIHLSPGTLDGTMMPMSGEGTRLVERWEFSGDRLSMDRILTIYDPYYTKPLIRRRGSARDDVVDVNEQAPCDPDGFYLDLLDNGLIEQKLGR